MALSVAELKAIASLDTSKFEAGTDRMGKSAQKAGDDTVSSGKRITDAFKGIAAAAGAAFTVGAIIGFQKHLMATARAAQTAADAIGVSAGTMDDLQDMAEQMGQSGDMLTQKWAKLLDSQEAAIMGNKEMAKSFERLGISMKDLQSLSPEDLLLKVARGQKGSATGITNLNDVMGKGAAISMRPMLDKLAAGGMPDGADADAAIRTMTGMGIALKKLAQWRDEKPMELELAAAQAAGLAASPEEIEAQMGANKAARAEANRQRLEALAAERKRVQDEKAQTVISASVKQAEDVRKRTTEGIAGISVSAPDAADRLAKIGGVIGGQTSKDRGAQERMIQEQKLTNKMLAALEDIRTELFKKLDEISGS